MPSYDYVCHGCGHQLTVQRHFNETSLVSCPVCGREAMTRLISQVYVVKSQRDRARDVSWIDRDLANHIRKRANGRLSPAFQETLDRMESK